MKRLFLTICLTFIAFPTTIFAADPTPTANPTSESVTEKLSDQINNLKEKIASRVAELKLVEKRGFVGVVKEVSANQITITDINSSERNIDVDEITKFSAGSSKESFGLSDLKAGSVISAIGLFNKDSSRLLARFINSYTLPMYISGTIDRVDTTNFTINLAMEDGKSYLVDIENITKINAYSGELSEKIGFSKLSQGTRAVVIGYSDKKEKNRMVATRLLVFPDLPKNPKIVIAAPAVDTSNGSVTSSGSGKKLTPVN